MSCDCGPCTARRATRCSCGHGDALHDLAKNNSTRTSCSVSTGRDATPCGCRSYTPQAREEETTQTGTAQ